MDSRCGVDNWRGKELFECGVEQLQKDVDNENPPNVLWGGMSSGSRYVLLSSRALQIFFLPCISKYLFSHKPTFFPFHRPCCCNRISRPTLPSLKGHKKSFSISSRSSKAKKASPASVPDFWTPVEKEAETKKEMEPVVEEVREEATEEKATEEAPKEEEEAAPKEEEAADEREDAEAEPAAEEAETAAVEEPPKAVDAEAESATEEKKDEDCFATAADISTQATLSTTACCGAFSELIRNPFAKEESEEEVAEEPAAEEEKPAEKEEEDKVEEKPEEKSEA